MRQIIELMLTRSEIKGAPIREMGASSLALNREAMGDNPGSALPICVNLAWSPRIIPGAYHNSQELYHNAAWMPVSDDHLQTRRLDGDVQALGVGVDNLAVRMNRQRIV